MKQSPKFPSMKHVPWSQEESRRNKWMNNLNKVKFTDKEAVMTEKMDGGNACLTYDKVYARSHGHETSHVTFDLLKKRHREELMHKIPNNLAIYGEWLYAKHSIKYTDLPDYFLVFGVFNMEEDDWFGWEGVKEVADQLGLNTVPVIKRGQFDDSWKMEPSGESRYGDTREGFVYRTVRGFKHENFENHVAKCVRNNHVQTDEHWRKKWRRGEGETNNLAGE